jgi:Ribbon-helix-helix domain
MKSLVVKHSIAINGQRTSISLEEVFWNSLKEIARERGESLQHLITSIDADRQFANLSSRAYPVWPPRAHAAALASVSPGEMMLQVDIVRTTDQQRFHKLPRPGGGG